MRYKRKWLFVSIADKSLWIMITNIVLGVVAQERKERVIRCMENEY